MKKEFGKKFFNLFYHKITRISIYAVSIFLVLIFKVPLISIMGPLMLAFVYEASAFEHNSKINVEELYEGLESFGKKAEENNNKTSISEELSMELPTMCEGSIIRDSKTIHEEKEEMIGLLELLEKYQSETKEANVTEYYDNIGSYHKK